MAWPKVDDLSPEEKGSVEAALHLMRKFLLLILEHGHADATRTRAGAVAFMFGLFATPAEMAKALKIAPSTAIRAVSEMEAELFCTNPPVLGQEVPEQKENA